MASINLKVKSDFAQASKDLKSFGTLTDSEAKRVAAYQKSFTGESIDKFIDKNRRLGVALQANKGDTVAIIAQQKALEKQSIKLIQKGIDPENEAIQDLNDEYNRLQKEYDQTATKQKKQGTQSDETVKKLVKMALGFVGIHKAIALVNTSLQDFTDYSKAIANVNTLIDISDKEFTSLNESLTIMSEQFAIQKEALSAGVYQALSSGAEDLGEALEIVERSAILSKGALIENALSVDIVTTAMNAYGSNVVDAEKATDIFFNTVKEGKITGAELSATIGQSISVFAGAKIPIEELGAGIATLTKVGVSASEATTQLNGIVTAFIKPSVAMSAALEAQGIASGSALLETQGLSGAMEFLETATQGNIEKLGEIAPNLRGMRGAMALSANEGKELNSILESFTDVSGSANEALLKQTEGFAGDAFEIEQAKIKLQNMRIEIGSKLLPILADFSKVIDHLDVILPVIATATATLVIAFKGMAILSVVNKALIGTKLALTALAGPAGLVATGITAIVTAMILLKKQNDKKLEESFGEISKHIQISAKEMGTISNQFATQRMLNKSIDESLESVAKSHGISKDELKQILAYSEALTDEDSNHFKNVSILEKFYETREAMDLEAIEKSKELAEEDKKRSEAELQAIEDEKAAMIQLYVDQNTEVQKILASNRTEAEQAQDKIDAIDEQIASITKLSLKDSKFKDDQLKAVKILEAEKIEIAEEEAKRIEETTEVVKAENIIVLEDYKKLQAEKEKLDISSIKNYSKSVSNALDEARALADGTKELNAEVVADYVAQAAEATGSVELAAVAAGIIIWSTIGEALMDDGTELWEKALIIWATLVAFGIGGAIVAAIIMGFKDAEEAVASAIDEVSTKTEAVILANRKDTIDQTLELELDRIESVSLATIASVRATLNERETETLKTLGVLEDTESEAIERLRDESLESFKELKLEEMGYNTDVLDQELEDAIDKIDEELEAKIDAIDEAYEASEEAADKAHEKELDRIDDELAAKIDAYDAEYLAEKTRLGELTKEEIALAEYKDLIARQATEAERQEKVDNIAELLSAGEIAEAEIMQTKLDASDKLALLEDNAQVSREENIAELALLEKEKGDEGTERIAAIAAMEATAETDRAAALTDYNDTIVEATADRATGIATIDTLETNAETARETARTEYDTAVATAMTDALTAITTNSQAELKAITDIFDGQATAQSETELAEEAYQTQLKQYAYDYAVYQKSLAIAQAKTDKAAALASLPWYYQTDLYTDKKDDVSDSYDDLIDSIKETVLPANPEDTPVPTAATGTPLGGFTVPSNPNSSAADTVGVNVSPGETVSVSPRGQGGLNQNIIVQIDKETIFNVMNSGIESGDVRITTENIQGGVSVA